VLKQDAGSMRDVYPESIVARGTVERVFEGIFRNRVFTAKEWWRRFARSVVDRREVAESSVAGVPLQRATIREE
jgi:hypothetical protein